MRLMIQAFKTEKKKGKKEKQKLLLFIRTRI